MKHPYQYISPPLHRRPSPLRSRGVAPSSRSLKYSPFSKLASWDHTINTLLGVPGTGLPHGERLCRELATYPAADMKKI